MINSNNRGLITSKIDSLQHNNLAFNDSELLPWFRAAKTSVWWDMKTCPVPDRANPTQIAKNISSALCQAGFTGPVSNIDAFMDLNQLKRRFLGDLLKAGIKMNHCPGKRNNDGKDLLMAIMLWTMNNSPPANVLLISGNPIYANGLHAFRSKKYNILLIRPDKLVATALLESATTIWYWASIVKGRGGVSVPAVDRRIISGTFPYHINYSVNHHINAEPYQAIKNPQGHRLIQFHQPKMAEFNQSFAEQHQPMKPQGHGLIQFHQPRVVQSEKPQGHHLIQFHQPRTVQLHRSFTQPHQPMKPQVNSLIQFNQPRTAQFHHSLPQPHQPMKPQGHQENTSQQANKWYSFSDEIWTDLCNFLLVERKRRLFLRQRTMFDAVQFLQNSYTRIRKLSVQQIFQLLRQCIEDKHWIHISGQDWHTAAISIDKLKAYKTNQRTQQLPLLSRPPDTTKLEVDLIIDSIQKFEMLRLDSDPSEADRGILLKLKTWLLQNLPRSSFGYRIWLIKNCFLEDTGLCLEPQIFRYLLKEFPEDFHCNSTTVFIKEKQDSDNKTKRKNSVNK